MGGWGVRRRWGIGGLKGSRRGKWFFCDYELAGLTFSSRIHRHISFCEKVCERDLGWGLEVDEACCFGRARRYVEGGEI